MIGKEEVTASLTRQDRREMNLSHVKERYHIKGGHMIFDASFPGYGVQKPDQEPYGWIYQGSQPIVRVDPDAMKRLREFTSTHPMVDLSPVISDRIRDLMDESERAENG